MNENPVEQDPYDSAWPSKWRSWAVLPKRGEKGERSASGPHGFSEGSKTIVDERFRTRVVQLIILERDPAKAIEELSSHYGVQQPSLRVGLPKGEKRALGCYVQKERAIYLSSSEYFYDPYVVIHEFYHHLRSSSGRHRGTEKHARDFAIRFLRSFEVSDTAKKNSGP